MIFIDSNIPMYLIGAPHPNKDAAVRLLEQVIGRGERLVTDAEVLQEILHRYHAIRRHDAIQPAFDAVLRPSPRSDGGYLLVFLQSGAAYPLRRLDAATAAAEPAVPPAQLAEYAGMYPLASGFALKVFVENGALKAQATGQGAFVLAAAGKDRFTADAYGIEIRFTRADGQVTALELLQGGQVLRGAKQ